MQKKTKLTVTVIGALIILSLLSLLLYNKNTEPETFELNDGFMLQMQEEDEVVNVSFQVFASNVTIALPKTILNGGHMTGSINYLYSSNCEHAVLESDYFSFQLLCKSGQEIDQDDLSFTKEQFKESLESAGYDCRNADYESYHSDSESSKYTLEFHENAGGTDRWYYYYNYVTLPGNAMYTVIIRLDSPANTEREIMCSLLDNSIFETAPLPEMEESAGLGNAYAQFYLGLRYYGGNDLPQSDTDAFLLIQKAAESGYRPAILYFGYFIFNGIGTKADEEAGMAMIAGLAESGYEPAESWLAALSSFQKEALAEE